MSIHLRAALSVLLLVGFFTLAFGTVIGLVVLTVWLLVEHDGAGAGGLALLAAVLGAGLGIAVRRVAQSVRGVRSFGTVLTEDDAPELWATVGEVASAVGTRAPTSIRLTFEVNASVSEDVRLLGLTGGTRRMALGLPLLQGLDVSQLRAVLAHEMGHFSRRHTYLAPLVRRGEALVVASVQELRDNRVGQLLLSPFARLFLRVSADVRRRQELEADAFSVRVAGRDVAARALRELDVISTTWQVFLHSYVTIGWDDGLGPPPAELLPGFALMTRGYAAAIGVLRAEAPSEESSPWDAHPSTAARLVAMATTHEPRAVPVDKRPASVLVPDLERHAEQVAWEEFAYGSRAVLPWDQLAAAALPRHDQREADVVYRAVGRLSGRGRGDLDDLLGLLATGGAPALARDVARGLPDERQREVLVAGVTCALRAAAVWSGSASWQLSWSAPTTLIDISGEPVDYVHVARLAVDPATTDQARTVLAECGVDLAEGVQVSEGASIERSSVLTGIANVKANRRFHDLLVLDTGLVLVPSPARALDGAFRLHRLLRSGTPAQLVAQHWFVPYDAVTTVRVRKAVPARLELAMVDGSTLLLRETWGGARLHPSSSRTLVAGVSSHAQVEEAPAR
ncbi:M48 family metallopeptidase [Cellulosimicrobium protaetiae]|uniref:M48 family metalloprotease n=1 Tax=Cellulosimicrobium protaetiae TaxID=2587808 RepID=A0A6M5UFI7_9MICO|nr:M48 family metallopeptidase [Cellulosimicrobium protaetiae]QJW36061.1 M48 family metalloprotease [Cellulosimicrobium protaetiae]